MSAEILRRAAKAIRDEWKHEGAPFLRAKAYNLAVAAWLDSIAETHEEDPSDYCSGGGHHLDGDPDECRSWWCWNVRHALTVARAYLDEVDQ